MLKYNPTNDEDNPCLIPCDDNTVVPELKHTRIHSDYSSVKVYWFLGWLRRVLFGVGEVRKGEVVRVGVWGYIIIAMKRIK